MTKLLKALLLATPLLLLPACGGAPADRPTTTADDMGAPPPLADATAAADDDDDLSHVRLSERNVRRAYEAYAAMLEAVRDDPERYAAMMDGDEDDSDAMSEDLALYPELERLIESKGVEVYEMAEIMTAVAMAWFAQDASPEAQSYFEGVPERHREFVAAHQDLIRTLMERVTELSLELDARLNS